MGKNETSFQKKYLNSEIEERDRFQVEFNKQERDQFSDMQIFIEQSKDATAIKQMAILGWLAISNHNEFMLQLKETLFINEKNNRRLGVNVKVELENKFQQRLMKIGGKL